MYYSSVTTGGSFLSGARLCDPQRSRPREKRAGRLGEGSRPWALDSQVESDKRSSKVLADDARTAADGTGSRSNRHTGSQRLGKVGLVPARPSGDGADDKWGRAIGLRGRQSPTMSEPNDPSDDGDDHEPNDDEDCGSGVLRLLAIGSPVICVVTRVAVAHVCRHVDDIAAGSTASPCGAGVAPPGMSTVSAGQLP
jgi:hypothetical protein